jgi:hypothetical protein
MNKLIEVVQEVINLWNSRLPLNYNTVQRCQQALASYEQKERVYSEEILCAAIWFQDAEQPIHTVKNVKGLVLCGYRHGHIIGQITTLTGKRMSELGASVQGFLTNRNRFLDRKEALKLFKANGGVPEFGDELYSEDLYTNESLQTTTDSEVSEEEQKDGMFKMQLDILASQEQPISSVVSEEDVNSIINRLDTPEGLDQYSYDEGFREGYKSAPSHLEEIEKWVKESMIREEEGMLDRQHNGLLESLLDKIQSLKNK